MDISISVGNVTVLTVKGDIDASNFQDLIEKANQVLKQNYLHVVIDLSQVGYVSSAGLVAFQNIAGHAAGMGGKIAFSGPNAKVAKVFDLTGFNKILGVFPDLASAKESLGQK